MDSPWSRDGGIVRQEAASSDNLLFGVSPETTTTPTRLTASGLPLAPLLFRLQFEMMAMTGQAQALYRWMLLIEEEALVWLYQRINGVSRFFGGTLLRSILSTPPFSLAFALPDAAKDARRESRLQKAIGRGSRTLYERSPQIRRRRRAKKKLGCCKNWEVTKEKRTIASKKEGGRGDSADFASPTALQPSPLDCVSRVSPLPPLCDMDCC